MDLNQQPNLKETRLRIIVVDDEVELRTVLVNIFSRLGHDVRGAGDGVALDLALADYPADIVILDLNLPGEDGVVIAQRLRRSLNCGIIMTTSRAQVEERVSGFQNGADLYFVKPIDPIELHAALLNLAQRLIPASSSRKAVWHFDPHLSLLRTPNDISINLTAQECIVLECLFSEPGRTVSRAEIFSALGHPDDDYGGQRVETLLSRLRSKVRSFDPESELPIRARHGHGYAFLADSQE